MKKLVSYFFVFNLILFGLIACETRDNSTGFYTGDSLATKETNEAKEIPVQEEKENAEKSMEPLVDIAPAVIDETSQIDEQELDYK